jgi:branched-chain amino acid transport system substrate-binding protein
VVCSCLAEEAANIMLQARRLGLKTPFIGGNGFNSPKLFEISTLAGEGTFVGSPWANSNPAAANQKFVAAYKQRYGTEPNQFAAQAYDAMNIAAAALQRIKLSGALEADRQSLRDALPNVTINGATGVFKFRPAAGKGGKAAGFDADQTPFVYVIQGGKFVLYKGK